MPKKSRNKRLHGLSDIIGRKGHLQKANQLADLLDLNRGGEPITGWTTIVVLGTIWQSQITEKLGSEVTWDT